MDRWTTEDSQAVKWMWALQEINNKESFFGIFEDSFLQGNEDENDIEERIDGKNFEVRVKNHLISHLPNQFEIPKYFDIFVSSNFRVVRRSLRFPF